MDVIRFVELDLTARHQTTNEFISTSHRDRSSWGAGTGSPQKAWLSQHRHSLEMCQRDGLPTWILLAYQKISSHWISVRKRLQRNFRFQSQDTRQNHTFHLVVFIFFIFFVSIYHLFLQTYTPIKWVELSTRIAPCCSHLFVSGYHGPPPWGNATRAHPASSTLHGARRDLFAGHLQRRPRRRNLEGFEWPVDQTMVGECRGALGWSKKVQNGNVKPGKMYEHVDESMIIAW